MKGWAGTMEEKDMDKEYARLKRGIEEGWLFNDKEDDEVDADDFQFDKESVFEKYKKDLDKEADK